MAIGVARGAKRGQAPLNLQKNKSNMAGAEWQEIPEKNFRSLGMSVKMCFVVVCRYKENLICSPRRITRNYSRPQQDYEHVAIQYCQDSHHHNELIS